MHTYKIYLIGHKSPDLDATSGPVAYAEFLEKINRYPGAELVPAVVDDINGETEFVFKKFNVAIPRKISSEDISSEDRIILIDHNEEGQRMDGIQGEQILEIVDHHKINISFSSPIRIDVRPHGSVSSVIYESYVKEHIEPSTQVASLIVASILSDTQGLKSSTTTGWDVKTAHDLAETVGIDIEALTFEIFKAKSDITGLSPEEIIRKDYKVFEFSGKKVFIGQVETVEPELILEMKNTIVSSIQDVKVAEGVGILFLAITDILKINSQIIYETEEEQKILELAFNGVGENNVIEIGPRMSRKKDIAPPIEKVISH